MSEIFFLRYNNTIYQMGTLQYYWWFSIIQILTRHEILQLIKKWNLILTNSFIMLKNSQTYLKYLPVFTMQYFKSMCHHFSTLRWKGLNYKFEQYFKRIISIIFCKTLTFPLLFYRKIHLEYTHEQFPISPADRNEFCHQSI